MQTIILVTKGEVNQSVLFTNNVNKVGHHTMTLPVSWLLPNDEKGVKILLQYKAAKSKHFTF